jgi:hypothetical protein
VSNQWSGSIINGGKLKRMRRKFRIKERKRKVKGCVVSPWGYTMINKLRIEVDLGMIKKYRRI